MIVCGLKLTHDGCVAVLDGDQLLFSTEVEKLDGNPRFQPLDRLELVEEILTGEGLGLTDIDAFVVDGWFAAPGTPAPVLRVTSHGRPAAVEVAPYCEPDALPWQTPLTRRTFPALPLGPGTEVSYASHHHVTQHVLGAYCTSPFARDGEGSLVLVWDGGTTPRLYEVETSPQGLEVRSLGPLLPVYGSAFADYAAQFEPFRARDTADVPDEVRHLMPPHLDVAGKAMAYASLGRDEPDFDPVLDLELARLPLTFDTAAELGRHIGGARQELWPGARDADLVASFQGYLGRRLLEALTRRLGGADRPNLCIAGGCALNIKWNSAIRSSGRFREVWVPPFPNDSGAALGAAAAELVHHGGTRIDWNIYSGPRLRQEPLPAGWSSRPCDAAGLARFLHETGAPVAVLHDRAELGPRALGNRSILAPATESKMKDVLNAMKNREDYRPVAPVCLEHRAPEIFDPGCPDPYMLFDHMTRPGWDRRIPAVVHLDGTARLQTVSYRDNPFLAEVLTVYERLSHIPVLCNTSANEKGRGFFPSVAAAARWGSTEAVWSDGVLHTRGS